LGKSRHEISWRSVTRREVAEHQHSYISHVHLHFKMAAQTTTAKFSDLYELKEELGK
jgi:hypothetical protein